MKVRTQRSLKATSSGLEKANKAVLKYPTKIDLAAEIEISRATVQNFFAGKAISRENFHKICQKLELPWTEIAQLPTNAATSSNQNPPDIDTLVQQLKQQQQPSIEHSCSNIRVLDMSQPRRLQQIYTSINILTHISHNQRLPPELTQLLPATPKQQISAEIAVQNNTKLIILGKPGAGKTTFLKHLALKCSQGELLPQLLPLFISLKDWLQTQPQLSLVEYISQQISSLSSINTSGLSVAQQILTAGRALILLDGLDEVGSKSPQVILAIRHFSNSFPRNQIVITCRVGSCEYTFEQFSEVEIADWDNSQISDFVKSWFAQTQTTNNDNAQKFLHKLQQQQGIQELATNPLLLTLLCLMFESGADFPRHRVELYQEAIEILLKKWDQHRYVQRQGIIKHLSLQHQQDLLSHIAYRTFVLGDVFFRQQQLETCLADYLENLSAARCLGLEPDFESATIIKELVAEQGLLVERAKGIYAFSHLTFHEYLVARQIVTSAAPPALEMALQHLVAQITQPRWREVFVLTVGMLRHADYLLLLIKQHLDRFLAEDDHLQAFLKCLSEKSLAVNVSYKLGAVQFFYLALERMLALVSDRLSLDSALVLVNRTFETARILDQNLIFNRNLEPDLDLDRALILALARAIFLNNALELDSNSALELDLALALELNLTYALDLAINYTLEPQLELHLKKLESQLPNPEAGIKKFRHWWQTRGKSWTNKLRSVIISGRQIGSIWQFNNQQRETLNNYYNATCLLVECLNSCCYVSEQVRQKIENTLFSPIYK